MSDAEDLDLNSVFTEQPRPPSPEPKFATYTRDLTRKPNIFNSNLNEWRTIKIRLVGSHPLWAHYLWNAALAIASHLDSNVDLYKNLCVLELGAGGALPSIVAAKNGARKVVVTDYPDASLIDNISYNVSENLESDGRVDVKGYIWGQTVAPLLSSLPSGVERFQVVVLSDLIFNHSQHDALLTTCEQVLAPGSSSNKPCLLVFYSHHRPHLAHRDMEFFTKARDRGWSCAKIVTQIFPAMFPEDSGDESVRSTVHGWKLTRADQ